MESYTLVILFIILISFQVGCTLRCACKEDSRNRNTCTSIHKMAVNFKTAQKLCMEKGGKLLTSSSKTIDSLLFNQTGHFWVGTEGNCLSGSSKDSQNDIVTLIRGVEDAACSSQCMSASMNRTLTERSCEEQVDGFLCDGIQWEDCWEDRALEVQILNKKDCLLAPCEHHCAVVPGGHMCSCMKWYRPRKNNPEHCEYYCDFAPCPLLSNCPNGFIRDWTQCTDIDECSSNLCEQICTNTIGSYKCSCHEGFVLVNQSKCVHPVSPTPLTAAFTPSANYTMSHAAFATPAECIGLTLFIMLAISALIGLLYYLRKRKSDLLLKDSDVPDNTMV